jgi:hypothetical protein
MNVEHLRRSLKLQWLDYYRENRNWLDRLGVWVNCEGVRRPSSSFILGTLSVLEPRLTKTMPLVVDLSSHADRIVIALGLNFNPDEELRRLEQAQKLLPDRTQRSSTSAYPADATATPVDPVHPVVNEEPASDRALAYSQNYSIDRQNIDGKVVNGDRYQRRD